MMTVQQIADELGRLKAERDAITARMADLKDDLLSMNAWQGEGEEYKFRLVTQIRKMTDWRTVAGRLRPSRQLITAHTSRQCRENLVIERL